MPRTFVIPMTSTAVRRPPREPKPRPATPPPAQMDYRLVGAGAWADDRERRILAYRARAACHAPLFTGEPCGPPPEPPPPAPRCRHCHTRAAKSLYWRGLCHRDYRHAAVRALYPSRRQERAALRAGG